jgi:hypothetical protein
MAAHLARVAIDYSILFLGKRGLLIVMQLTCPRQGIFDKKQNKTKI